MQWTVIKSSVHRRLISEYGVDLNYCSMVEETTNDAARGDMLRRDQHKYPGRIGQ